MPLLLAPMAGFTDAPFRLLCAGLGTDGTVSEMISAKAVVMGDKKTAALSKILPGEAPAALQLFGHEPEIMEEAVRLLASGSCGGSLRAAPPAAFDINMGCPVKKIITNGDGSALMRNPALCGEITAAAVRGAAPYNIPVTVKIRAGWSETEKNACEVALACAEGGAVAVTVHARTREQLYTPGVDLDVIAAVRRALPRSVAVVGNGDIRTPEDARKMAEYTGCNAVMIGREALGNPWIFSKIKYGDAYIYPDEAQKLQTAAELVCAIVREKGETAGVREARGRAAHFIKGLPGAAEKRAALNKASTLHEVRQVLDVDA